MKIQAAKKQPKRKENKRRNKRAKHIIKRKNENDLKHYCMCIGFLLFKSLLYPK